MVAAIANVPPFAPEPEPPEPSDDEVYGHPGGPSSGELRRYERAHKAWERECKEVEKRNAAARAEWDAKYLTASNIKAAEDYVRELRQKAEKDAAAAKADREKAAQDRSAAEGLRRDEERLINAKAQGRYDARTARLEAFCEHIRLSNGQTALDAFEASERDRVRDDRDDR